MLQQYLFLTNQDFLGLACRSKQQCRCLFQPRKILRLPSKCEWKKFLLKILKQCCFNFYESFLVIVIVNFFLNNIFYLPGTISISFGHCNSSVKYVFSAMRGSNISCSLTSATFNTTSFLKLKSDIIKNKSFCRCFISGTTRDDFIGVRSSQNYIEF